MSEGKVALWVAVIGALGVIVAAIVTGGFGLAAGQSGPGNVINQNGGTNNVACQDHSTCSAS